MQDDGEYPNLVSKKVLLVDDDDFVRDSTTYFLKSYDLEVMAVANAPDAVKVFSEQSFDLVVLDMLLPNQSGGVAAYFAFRKKSATMPILLCSGEELSLRDAIFDGDLNVRFLQKPYDPIGFLNELSDMLS